MRPGERVKWVVSGKGKCMGLVCRNGEGEGKVGSLVYHLVFPQLSFTPLCPFSDILLRSVVLPLSAFPTNISFMRW